MFQTIERYVSIPMYVLEYLLIGFGTFQVSSLLTLYILVHLEYVLEHDFKLAKDNFKELFERILKLKILQINFGSLGNKF